MDMLALDFWKQPIGLFGYFECIRNPQAARLLLETACAWLKEGGMETHARPVENFVSQEWGMVVEGFTPSPIVMAPYNPAFYNEYQMDFGLQKVKDLLCWYVSAQEGYHIPPRILELTDTVAKRYGIHVRPVDMHRYEDEVKLIVELSNSSIIDNWGYSPVTEAEVQATACDLKPVVATQGGLVCRNHQGASGRVCHCNSRCQFAAQRTEWFAPALWLVQTTNRDPAPETLSHVCPGCDS